jgi:hypothetical protein
VLHHIFLRKTVASQQKISHGTIAKNSTESESVFSAETRAE